MRNIDNLSPNKIYDELSVNVVGQEEAKKTLSLGIFNHMKRSSRLRSINFDEERVENSTNFPEKSNIIMLGNSGSGKTMMMKELKKICKEYGFFFYIDDASNLTTSGIKGRNIGHMLADFDKEADEEKITENIKKTAIVYLDEIDKLCKDKYDWGVLQELLTLIEGTKKRFTTSQDNYEISGELDTTNILFIVGGVFDSLREDDTGGIGFNSKLDKSRNHNKEIKVSDFINAGYSEEFIGRFNIITKLEDMTKETLRTIFIEKVLPKYATLFKWNNVKAELNHDEIENILDEVLKDKTGARGLNNYMENLLNKSVFNTEKKLNNQSINQSTNIRK